MIETMRRLAIPIAITTLIVNVIILLFSLALWVLAIANGWLDEVSFVSHVSMLALVFAGASGIASAIAGILALVPTDDIIEKVTGGDDE